MKKLLLIICWELSELRQNKIRRCWASISSQENSPEDVEKRLLNTVL